MERMVLALLVLFIVFNASYGSSNREQLIASMKWEGSSLIDLRAGAKDSDVESDTDAVILVVGSVNADVTVPIKDFPVAGETILTSDVAGHRRTAAGGKGANQAVACRRLSKNVKVKFVTNIGNDLHAHFLKSVLMENDLDLADCEEVEADSGLGLVFLQRNGNLSSIVVAGANECWPDEQRLRQKFERIFAESKVRCVLLQMEVPSRVNEIVAEIARKYGAAVCQDVGGEEREISEAHLRNCDIISPNLSELRRMTKHPVDTGHQILAAARKLQHRGARSVLVTRGREGSLLLTESGEVLTQRSYPLEKVVDETGAGDNFRAAFATARFVEDRSLQESLALGAAAGAVSVSKLGAIPSCAKREECNDLLHANYLRIRGGHDDSHHSPAVRKVFEFKFASRLNSMKDRQDLWENGVCDDVWSWIKRQGTIKGLDLIDFNYPQHIKEPVTKELASKLHQSLAAANLQCGAICMRFPKSMQLGAYTNPDNNIRRAAIQLTKEACEWAMELGANEVVVWSAFDGYDYSLQANYDEMWDKVVDAFKEVCDAFPTVKVSLEYKPTDENTRFFAVPSTGAAILLLKEVNRTNFGLTLDFGHCLMAGENPAQSVAMVQNFGKKLFGVQLGDGYGRLGAEDGLAFGSIHRTAALEFLLWLKKTNYTGHLYFDTFPRNEDPVRECEYNLRQCKRMLQVVDQLLQKQEFHRLLASHDAMRMLELLETYHF